MRFLIPVTLAIVYLACTADVPTRAAQVAAPARAVERVCMPTGTALTRTTLYFGLTRRSGTVSERQWRAFLRDEVTPRFPNGLTVWEAAGQWRRADGRIDRERAKVLLVVHDEKPEVAAALSQMIEAYKHTFQQESVLWETAPVCAAF